MEHRHHKQIKAKSYTSGCVLPFDKLDECYEQLLIAIYYRAIVDVYESRHVNHKHLHWEQIIMYGADALNFLKDNPYALDINYKSILSNMETHEFIGKENYKKHDCWNV